MASPFAEPLANPLLSKWLCVLKDAWFVTASHLPVPQCQSTRRGRQPWEILSFLSAPSLTRGDLLSLRSHSRQRASVLPNIREWLLPPGGLRWHESGSKSYVLWPRRAIRDNVCAATRMAQSERSRPSRTDLTARLQGAFKHSDPTDNLWSRRAAPCPVACAEMRLRQPYVPRLQRECLTSSQ